MEMATQKDKKVKVKSDAKTSTVKFINRAIKSLKRVGASKHEFSKEELVKIKSTLETAVTVAMQKLATPKSASTEEEFNL